MRTRPLAYGYAWMPCPSCGEEFQARAMGLLPRLMTQACQRCSPFAESDYHTMSTSRYGWLEGTTFQEKQAYYAREAERSAKDFFERKLQIPLKDNRHRSGPDFLGDSGLALEVTCLVPSSDNELADVGPDEAVTILIRAVSRKAVEKADRRQLANHRDRRLWVELARNLEIAALWNVGPMHRLHETALRPDLASLCSEAELDELYVSAYFGVLAVRRWWWYKRNWPRR